MVEAYHPTLHSLLLDDTTATQNAVQYLIDLGHRKIAYINEPLDDPFGFPFSRNRYRGYCQALEKAGIPLNPNYYREDLYGREEGRKMALDLLSTSDPPTAICTYCDIYALGVLEAARELNLKVPHDLSVVGYDDIELARFAQLTTIRQHLFKSGILGIEMLLDAIHQTDTPTNQLQLSTELIVRRTTAPPK